MFGKVGAFLNPEEIDYLLLRKTCKSWCVAGAGVAEPGSDGDSGEDGAEAVEVETSVAFVAQDELLRLVAGAALLAPQIAVIGTVDHGVLGPLHDLRQGFELLRRRGLWPERGGGAAAPGMTRRWRH